MTAAPLELRSSDFASEPHTSSSAHGRQAKASAFHHELAARIAEGNEENAGPAEESNPTAFAPAEPKPQALLRSSLTAQNAPSLEWVKAIEQQEYSTKPLSGLEEAAKLTAAAVQKSNAGVNITRTNASVVVNAQKAHRSRPAGETEANDSVQTDSTENLQAVLGLTEKAQATAQVSQESARASTAEKSVDKISGDASEAAGEIADVAADPQPVAITGDLSLALKISGESAKTAGDQKALASGFDAAAATGLHGQAHEADHGNASRDQDTAPPATTEIGDSGNFKTENAAKSETISTADTAATQMEHAGQLERLRNESVHGVHVQLESATNGKLDVRMVERAGQLSVTLRSSDPTVTRALQEHSSELTTRLALEHYRTEMWKPGTPESSNGKSPFQQSPEREGDTGRKRKDQNPQWVDETEQTPLSRKVTTTI